MSTTITVESEKITLRPTREPDLDFVLANELDPGNISFISQWTRAQHLETMADPNCAHFIIEANDNRRRVGHLIMRGLKSPDRDVELKRIAVLPAEHGQGFGRETLKLIKKVTFERWAAHRLYLDVMEHNSRAQHLYLSEGFLLEGKMRETLKRGDKYITLVLMSILEQEYFSA